MVNARDQCSKITVIFLESHWAGSRGGEFAGRGGDKLRADGAAEVSHGCISAEGWMLDKVNSSEFCDQMHYGYTVSKLYRFLTVVLSSNKRDSFSFSACIGPSFYVPRTVVNITPGSSQYYKGLTTCGAPC